MEPLAHSARAEKGIPSQTYHDHISAVMKRASANADNACRYLHGDCTIFTQAVINGAVCHDLGKLDPLNQDVLAGNAKKGLPVKHEDAGAACLLQNKDYTAAILASKHHQGLPDLLAERQRKKLFLRNTEDSSRTDQYLPEYIDIHNTHVPEYLIPVVSKNDTNWPFRGLRMRLALSCLVDADHGDTAYHYGNEGDLIPPGCRWQERLQALQEYTDSLFNQDPKSQRNILRREIFKSCKDAGIGYGIVACDSPVGTGKTTSVMAHLLNVAIQKKLRHIIVVLPYTNIIKQSVETYRNALVLPGENGVDIVAEHHHQADFEHIDSRYLTTLWKAPIIVTTAVQFFETIAANKPARLRKLHELPGTAVFIDEVHNAIPTWMWPQMWQWINELVGDWSCHFVLASGSLPRFWEFPKMPRTNVSISDLVPMKIRKEADQVERKRIKYYTIPEPLVLAALIERIQSVPGPRLVIMNTVQSAAVVAHELYQVESDKGKFDGYCNVLHLSTALCPADRDKVVDQIKMRLRNKYEKDWTLVATSCVEAGMDFSFTTAFRESCSVSSLIQIGGRANRHGEEFISEIWDFRISQDEKLLNKHPSFDIPRTVLAELFAEKKMDALTSTALATEAMRREIMSNAFEKRADIIADRETKHNFPEVASLCRVIDADTRTVVVSKRLIAALQQGIKVEHKDLLRNSVQLWPKKVELLALEEISTCPGIYKMPEGYYGGFEGNSKPCLGYMKGVLPLVYMYKDGLII
jgi:CRISPR-associated endonuclease/helicase Cas3